jgi:hypothetical protein
MGIRRLAVAYLCVLAACGFEHGALSEIDAFTVVPTVEFEEATSNADEASGIVQIAVVLSEPATDIVAVSYDVTGGNASRPDDYTLADGTVTFLPGQTRRTIDATILADQIEESDEDIVVTLSGPSGATIGTTNHHTITISADILPRVSFGNAATTSGNEASDETIQAGLTIAATEQVSVQLGVAGSATPGGVDHAVVDGQTITFAVGEMMKTVPLGVVQDALDEDDETADLALKNPTGKVLLAATGTTHTRTITDDDPLPSVQFMATASSTAESANATITVTLTPVSGRTVTVPYSVTGGTANVADATVVGAPGNLTFTAGQTTQTISVMVMQDTLDEADETIVITLGTPTNATLGTNTAHTLTITDDDNPPTFGAANSSVSEGDTGTKTVNVTATLSTASGRDVTVPYTVTGTANNPADYTITASPVSIPAGMTSVNIVITVKGDTSDEDNETVIVTMGTPTNATQGAITVQTVTINDDDAAPTVAFTSSGTSPQEGNANVTLTVQLSAVSGRDVTVPFTINASSTANDPADYTITSSPVTITAGNLSTTIVIAMKEDTLDEANETVVVDLDTPTGATLGTPATYTLTITDDDQEPKVSWDPLEINLSELEGTGPQGGPTRTVSYTIVLSAASGRDVTIPIDYSGTAASPSDYSGPASVMIAAGQTSTTVTLTIVRDGDDDGASETIIMDFGTVVNAGTQNPVTRTYTILDDDP